MGERAVRIHDSQIERAAKELCDEVRELSLGCRGEVDRIKGPLPPLDFLRNFVMPGRPCIITDCLDHWPALHKWSNAYLRSVLRNQCVSVHITPNGRADALVAPANMLSRYNCPVVSSPCFPQSTDLPALVRLGTDDDGNVNREGNDFPRGEQKDAAAQEGYLFVTAHVEKLLFPDALDLIVTGSRDEVDTGEVAYAQEQNGCFLSEYGALAADADVHIPWVTEALGCMPEAVNLWIGNQKAITSLHKDHYENLYAVVAGEKHFTLFPPTDVHRMYIRDYPSAHYSREMENSKLVIVRDHPSQSIPWVSVDPCSPSSQTTRAKFPRYYEGPEPFKCTVRAGELLYLPSMWFHHVQQSPDKEGRTIALNFWYDMQFDIRYAYYNFLHSLIKP